MKSILLNKKNPSHQESFVIHSKIYPHVYSLWHHHTEYEVLYIVKHSGTAYVGDKILPYEEGTLMLFCENLPHMLVPKLDPTDTVEEGVEDAYVLHFSMDTIAKIVDCIPEFKPLNKLFNDWQRGMIFKNVKKNEEILKIMQKITLDDSFNRITHFFELLNIIENDKDFEFIANPGFVNSINLPKGRLEKVYEYSINNFNDSSICLEDVAESINMNKAAFCRYFKKITNKTYFEFLNEIRIGCACKMLIEDKNKNITDIAYSSGFNNMSNFNRQFKLIKGKSPSTYIKLRRF
jgi:AraC-like DNA-binding protein